MQNKKINGFFYMLLLAFLLSCDTASTTQEAEQDSLDALDSPDNTITDTSALIDTNLSSLDDSIKADINEATGKIKERTRNFGDAAKQRATAGVDKIKTSAQKVQKAAKAGVDAAKKEFSE